METQDGVLPGQILGVVRTCTKKNLSKSIIFRKGSVIEMILYFKYVTVGKYTFDEIKQIEECTLQESTNITAANFGKLFGGEKSFATN